MSPASVPDDWTRHVVLITGADGKGHGSGFVARRAGAVAHVVTCAHVVSDLGATGLEANGKPAKVLWDGTADGIDLAVLAAEGLTEEPQTLTRGAAVGDEVFAIGFTRVDRGRRATARPATIREATQLTYDPLKVVKKHPGWLLAIEGDQVTDGFSGGPVVAADTGMVIGVLGLRGTGTADAIAISNLAAWRDAPPAVSPIRDEVERLRRSAFRGHALTFFVGVALTAVVALFVMQRWYAPKVVAAPGSGSGSGSGSGWFGRVVEGWQRGDVVVVQAASGWQVSPQSYEAGERLCVVASGRISLAQNDLYNLAEVLRPLIADHAERNSELARLGDKLGEPALSSANPFRRTWNGPAGRRGYRDGAFDDCLLRPASAWGGLLVTELRNEIDSDYDARDPLEVLSDNGASVDGVRPLNKGGDYVMTKAGKLGFIVNDMVLSEQPTAKPLCQQGLAALDKAQQALAGIPNSVHLLDVEPPALAFYLDNGGAFQVRITRGKCGVRDTMRPAGRDADPSGDNTPPPLLAPDPPPPPIDAGRRGRSTPMPP